jgi:protein-tyrosine phosphatase
MREIRNVLFVCSRNHRRSLTAEAIFKKEPRLSVHSAGTSPRARVRVSEKMLRRASLIFVMEKKHKQILLMQFPDMELEKRMVVLDIPDEYGFMDENLVEILKTSVAPYLNQIDYH